MIEKKPVREMKLGELVNSLIILREDIRDKETHMGNSDPEIWNKCLDEYNQKHRGLIAELNRREQLYLKK